jgi:hypothetical protein
MCTISFRGQAAAACIFFAIAVIRMSAFAGNPEMMSKPGVPPVLVTAETLTSLRAAERAQEVDYQTMNTPWGTAPVSDGLADQGSASRAIRRAFRVPICNEWAWQPNGATLGHDPKPRFPFAVEANESLADALDKLKRNSGDRLQWLLLDKRIILTTRPDARKDEVYIMERPVHVDIKAETLHEALEQIETTYNKQHSDVPLAVYPPWERLVSMKRADASGKVTNFTVKKEGSLREIIVDVLDQTQDPAVIYGLSEVIDKQGRRCFTLTVRKEDAPELDESITAEDRALWQTLSQRFAERFKWYMARVPATGAGAAESATAVTKESLNEMRAVSGVDTTQFDGGLGLPSGMVTQSLAVVMLAKAFAIPLCQERDYQPGTHDGPEYPYAIEANEHLKDALDKVGKNSKEYLRWTLTHGRVVITSQSPAKSGDAYIMDRPVQVDIKADTLGQALEQIEAAYNKQYPDGLPFLADPRAGAALLKRSPEGTDQTPKLALNKEGTLRDVLLTVLDEMKDPALCYVSLELESEGSRYFAFRVTRYDVPVMIMPKTGIPVDPEAQAPWKQAQQRLKGYLSRTGGVSP